MFFFIHMLHLVIVITTTIFLCLGEINNIVLDFSLFQRNYFELCVLMLIIYDNMLIMCLILHRFSRLEVCSVVDVLLMTEPKVANLPVRGNSTGRVQLYGTELLHSDRPRILGLGIQNV